MLLWLWIIAVELELEVVYEGEVLVHGVVGGGSGAGVGKVVA